MRESLANYLINFDSGFESNREWIDSKEIQRALELVVAHELDKSNNPRGIGRRPGWAKRIQSVCSGKEDDDISLSDFAAKFPNEDIRKSRKTASSAISWWNDIASQIEETKNLELASKDSSRYRDGITYYHFRYREEPNSK